MSHSKLIGLSDQELLKLAPEATHQHFKGGLYRYLGPLMDADTGRQMERNGKPLVCYLHVYPHANEPWARVATEFFGLKDYKPRFRKLLA